MSKKVRVLLGGSEGRMGKVLCKMIAETRDIEVVYGFDPKLDDLKTLSDIVKMEKRPLNEMVDLYVDFSIPKAVVENVREASIAKIDSIIGTTGWYDRLDEVKAFAEDFNRRILYSPNFSPLVNVLFYTTRQIARLVGNYGYDATVREIHHSGKADAPSGTAVTLGNILREEVKNKTKLVYERSGRRLDQEIDVTGNRVGKVVGHHEVWFTPEGSYSERMVLQHDAFTPEAFGIGVLMGIRWLAKAQEDLKPSGLYTFYKDVLGMA